ncbi:DHH family phosphoesterase [Catenuloplanes japonicus]|uniref:exopolyphosphatase n=1 Tax=Catenuloplanes japonicus TaxID=33876 RepID=UPI001E4DD043|nr:exopolyphosphatase [Catenuloplanes japonicus]
MVNTASGPEATHVKHRLVTRSDFDGLVCAVLLRRLDMIDDVLFVHPKDVQDGVVDIRPTDILTNLPYAPQAHLVFDHHHSETIRVGGKPENHVIDASAPSAARVVYDYYGGVARFPDLSFDLMDAVDKADSAAYSVEEILRPTGWTLLNYLMDSRTGLGRFQNFRISNYQLMMQLIDACLHHQDVEQILALPDVAERVQLYRDQSELFVAQLKRVCTITNDVVVVDLRDEEIIHAGNRFMVYALYPEARVSVHVIWGRQKLNTVFAVGKSIVDRSSPVDVGAICLGYGGGGHLAAGTCQVPHEESERVLKEIVTACSAPRHVSA